MNMFKIAWKWLFEVPVLLGYGTVSLADWCQWSHLQRSKWSRTLWEFWPPESETTTLAQDVRYHTSTEVVPQPRHSQLYHCKSLKFASGCFMAVSLQPISLADVLRQLCVQFCLQLSLAHSPMPCYHSRKMSGQYLKLSELLPSTSFPTTYTLIFIAFNVT